jgi:glycerol-1-phosphatase
MDSSLADRHDAVLIDLDGVVYRGDQAIPGAGAALEKARGTGTKLVFLTNNSSRTPEEVAAKLGRMGIAADPGEVLTSALATSVMLEAEGVRGATAFVIGERGIRVALEGAGVVLVDGEPEHSDLVVVGFDRSADYEKLKRASLLVERGARLIATNGDGSYPAPDGLWPGAGALLAAIVATTGAAPTIVGKPSRPLFEAAARLASASSPLVVGDRLDTDVAGASTMGWDSLLVFSGAARPSDLVRSAHLPTYVAADVSAVVQDLPPGSFRPANPGDVAEITKLLVDSGLNSSGTVDRVDTTVVSTDDHEVTATACVQDFDGQGLLRSVAVRGDLRGKGLGMLAAASAVREARRRGVRHVALFTESAAPFFERMGFRSIDRTRLTNAILASAQAAEECPETASAMTLDL